MSEDLISRQAAINALEIEKTYSTAFLDGYAKTDSFEKYNMGLDDGIKAIKRLQSAQRKGKWIWMGDTGDSRWMCSVCKGKEKVPTIMGEPIVWEFCPNCGAWMKGEEDVRKPD